MRESYLLANMLRAEAATSGETVHDCFYLFESYEDVLGQWPRRNHEDLVFDRFCKSCAFDRVAEARRAGLPVVDHNVNWFDRPDEEDDFYDGPFCEYSEDSDSPRFCSDCGKVLSFSPTEYCLKEEIEAFQEACGADSRVSACELAILAELLDGAHGSQHEEEIVHVAANALKQFYVPAADELRSRLPTLSKLKTAWKSFLEDDQ